MGLLKKIISGVRSMFIGKARLEEAFDTQIVLSSKMEDACNLWAKMYANNPPWKDPENGQYTLNLPKAICAEFARLATFECEIEVTGENERAKYLNEQWQHFIKKLRGHVEKAGSTAGIVFKPYISGQNIRIAAVRAVNFFPTEFDGDGEIKGGIFMDFRYIGEMRYTRLEWHHFEGSQYVIQNKAYKVNVSTVDDDNGMLLGKRCNLTEVPDWAEVEEEVRLDDVDSTLFAYLKMPMANNIEDDSPLGVSLFASAVDDIRQADEQFSRIIYEYDAKEVIVFATHEAMDKDRDGRPMIPSGLGRLIRILRYENGNDFYQVFSPDFRDESLFNGLNRILRNVELQCGLAYGTFSDVQDVEKTATEVLASKQRSYSTVCDMQIAIRDALEKLLYAMDTLCTLYNLAPSGTYELACTFGDGVMEDISTEFTRRMAMVQANILRPELFLSWYFGCSEEDAKQMLPGQTETDFWGGA